MSTLFNSKGVTSQKCKMVARNRVLLIFKDTKVKSRIVYHLYFRLLMFSVVPESVIFTFNQGGH